jgi:tRNA(adenine34) deaminase
VIDSACVPELNGTFTTGSLARAGARPEKAGRCTLGGVGDEEFMRAALELAREAQRAGELPVGAVVAAGGRVIGRGRNSPIARTDPTAHAEILALREAAAAIGNYRLEGATVYVTLEPCAMCAGALVEARVRRLVFGARHLRFGAVRSKFRIADSELLNHRVEIVEGVLDVDCLELLQEFFRDRRKGPAGLDRP